MTARLSRIVLLMRDIQHGVRFYRDGIGLQLEVQTSNFARLATREGVAVELNAAET